MFFAVAPAVLYLSACADTVTVTATPDEISMQVIPIWDLGPADRKATAHCAQFGKDAHLAGEYGRIVQFLPMSYRSVQTRRGLGLHAIRLQDYRKRTDSAA